MSGEESVSFRFNKRTMDSFAAELRHGRYNPQKNAILEFTDNSAANRDRQIERVTHVQVTIKPDIIRVIDYGGQGGGLEDLQRFANIGDRPQQQSISQRGIGAKAAVQLLGTSMTIIAKPQGEGEPYRVLKVPNFEEIIGADFNIERHQIWRRGLDPALGYWDVEVTGLKEGATIIPSTRDLAKILGEEYRPILTSGLRDTGRIVFDNNGVQSVVFDSIKIKVLHQAGKRPSERSAERLYIPLDENYAHMGFSENDIRVMKTSSGNVLWGWHGVLDFQDPKSKAITKKGIRFYFDGKLLKTSDLGFNLSGTGLDGFIGEVHLDNLVAVREEFAISKSLDISDKAEIWRYEILPTVKEEFSELIESLSAKASQQRRSPPTEVLRECFDFARFVTNDTLKSLVDSGLIDLERLDSFSGRTTGQRHPVKSGENGEVKDRGKNGKKWDDETERTFPDSDSDKEVPRKRRSLVGQIDYRSLPDRAKVSVHDGTTLVINKSNPQVEHAAELGKTALLHLTLGEIGHYFAKELSEGDIERYQHLYENFVLNAIDNMHQTPQYQAMWEAEPRNAALRVRRR